MVTTLGTSTTELLTTTWVEYATGAELVTAGAVGLGR